MKKSFAKHLIVATVFVIGLLYSHGASAACQLDDTYRQVSLNKTGVAPSFASYATGETITATVKTKQGFDCENYQVQFMLCPVPGSSGADCSVGKVIGTGAVHSGSATVTWPAAQFNNFSNFRIKAAAGTDNPNAGASWQYYTDQFSILSNQACGITNFSAIQSGSSINFNVTSNSLCEGKAVGIELLIQSSNLGTSSGGTVASGKIANGEFSGSWTLDNSLGVVYFKACITGGTCQTSTTSGAPPGGGPGTTETGTSGSTQTYPFEITNPLKGGVTDFTSLIKIIAQWIFNLAIPIAVAMIVYAGILFLTAQGEPAKITKAKDVLKYAVIGLAIILIGSGFVTLIQSVLELGGTGTTQNQNPNPNNGLPTESQQQTGPLYGCTDKGYCVKVQDPNNVPSSYTEVSGDASCNNACSATGPTGDVGSLCGKDRDCQTDLKCKDAVCQRANGNFGNEPCNSGRNCGFGNVCDKNRVIISDGRQLGTCVAP